MKFKKTILIFIAFALLLMPSFVFSANKLTAQDAQSQLSSAVSKTGVETTSVEVIAGRVLKGALALVGLLFLILVFYGGFTWLIAKGNEEQIKKAKSTVIGSIIGLMIVLGSYAITDFVGKRIIKGESSKGVEKDISDPDPDDPTGCCLDRWETEGGFFGVGQSGWTGQILTKTQCDELIKIKDYDLQNIDLPRDGEWMEGYSTGSPRCQEIAQVKHENREWKQSSKWDNVGKTTSRFDKELPDDEDIDNQATE